MRRPFVACILSACILVPASPVRQAAAQAVAMEGVLPDSVVVTATRQEEDVRLTGRRVDVWTARDIAALPVTSVDELLRTIGGVEIQSRGGFGVQSDLTMRGSTFNGVLVLIDGARINDPMTGHFMADLPLPLSEIARVEVLRGPATVLYGPDAVGGVVHLFTYEGLRDRVGADGPLNILLGVEHGDHGLYGVSGALRGVDRATAWSAAVTLEGADGMPILQEDAPVRDADGALRTDFVRKAATAGLSRGLAGAQLFARIGLDTREFGAFHFYTASVRDTAREETATLWAQARLQQHHGRFPWTVQAAAKRHTDEYSFNPVTLANEHISHLYTVTGEVSTALVDRLRLTTGASVNARSIDSNNHGEHADVAGGVFSLFRWQPLASVVLHGGGRLDYDPSYGVEPSPQVSAAFNRGILTLYAGGGRAVRAPNYTERYMNTSIPRPRGQNLGDPNLDVERAWTYEAGAGLYPGGGLAFHAAYFNRTTDDLIDFATYPAVDTVWLARNLHRVVTRGIEADGTLNQSVGDARLRLSLSYAFLDSRMRRTDADLTYKYALSNARHLVQSKAVVEWRGAALGVQGLWKEPMEGNPYQADAYAVFNIEAGYAFDLGKQRLTLTAGLRNLFDTEYYEVFDAPMPGRWWIVGARLAR